MAVKICLRRMGKKKKPFYRVVVADSRSPRDGRFIEEIGTYNPLMDPPEYKIDTASAVKWLNNGAAPTDTVARIFKNLGIEKGMKVEEAAPAAPVEEAAPAAEEAPAEEAAE